MYRCFVASCTWSLSLTGTVAMCSPGSFATRWTVSSVSNALRQALCKGRPQIFNTDQGAQFTADAFTTALCAANIQVSMDGRGRALDNVFCERLWRSVKYENIYLNQYDTVRQLQTGLTAYLDFYNHERPHQSLNYRTPAEEHFVL